MLFCVYVFPWKYNRSILIKEKIQPLLPIIDQIADGLSLMNLLDTVRANLGVFKHVFCRGNMFDWTFEKLEEFVNPSFSENGSSKKIMEINVYKSFMDAMECIFYGGVCSIYIYISCFHFIHCCWHCSLLENWSKGLNIIKFK